MQSEEFFELAAHRTRVVPTPVDFGEPQLRVQKVRRVECNRLLQRCFSLVDPIQEQEAYAELRLGLPVGGASIDSAGIHNCCRLVVTDCKQRVIVAGQMSLGFQFAYQRIKPIHAVIVGTYPRFEDEVHRDAGYARTFGAPIT